MRVLSENETALLIGDLSKIQLPDGVELYLSFGIPQIFQRITMSDQVSIERDWLYFPASVLENLYQKKNNVPLAKQNTVKSIESIICDSYYLYPVDSEQKMDILLVSNEPTLDNVSQKTIDCILNSFDLYKEKKQLCGKSHDLFLQNLAKNNDSIHTFKKSILNLVVKNIPRSCASLYSDSKEVLIRSMVVGDISKFDLLKSIISSEEKSIWRNTVESMFKFIPTVLLRDEIQFLENPPDFKFLHKGLISSSSENYIAVIISGASDLSSIQLLRTITSMASRLLESDFIKSTSIIEYYKQYLSHSNNNISTQKLFEKMFLLLNEQVRVTRALLLRNQSTIEVSFSRDNVYQSKEIAPLLFDSKILDKFNNSKYYTENSPITFTQHEKKYESECEIVSEFVCKFSLQDGSEQFVAVAMPKSLEVLELYIPVIKNIVEAFVDCFIFQSVRLEYGSLQQKENLLLARTELNGKLTKGYFYEIFSKMTVLIGKTEQLKEHVSKSTDIDEINSLLKYLDTIEKNTDFVGESVAAIKSLIPNDNTYYKRKINASEMMSKIPQYLGGYMQHLSIGNSFSLRIDNTSQANADFLISGADVDDVLIPVILSVLDSAIKSGTVAVSACREVGVNYLKISFHQELIGQKNSDEIILKTFDKFKLYFDDSGSFKFGSLQISSHKNKDEMISIMLRLQETQDLTNNLISLIGENTSV